MESGESRLESVEWRVESGECSPESGDMERRCKLMCILYFINDTLYSVYALYIYV